MQSIYVMQAGTRVGPLSEEETKQRYLEGKIAATEQVWYEGQDQWIPMTDVAAKNSWSKPVLPPAAPPAPAKEYINLRCRECGYSGQMPLIAKKYPWWSSWLLLVPVVFFLCFLVGPVYSWIPFLIGISILLSRGTLAKAVVDCANCGKRLTQL